MARRIFVWLLCIAFAIPAIVAGYVFWVVHSIVIPYEHIARGDSESQILGRLGRPSRITGSPKFVAFDSDFTVTENHGECVKEFWYVPVSITGEAYTVGFNSQGKAVSKYHYSSP